MRMAIITPEDPEDDTKDFNRFYKEAEELGHADPLSYAVMKVGK